MKDLEKIVGTEKKHFDFKATLAGAMTVLSLGLYSGNANAESGNLNDKNGVPVRVQVHAGQVYENNKVIGQAREDGRVIVNPSNANRFHSTPIMNVDETYENDSSTSQVKSTQQSKAIDETITNVDDYLKRAGEELERKNTSIARDMYDHLADQRNKKNVILSKNQELTLYIGKAQSFVLENRFQEGILTYKAADKKFPNNDALKYYISQLEKKLTNN